MRKPLKIVFRLTLIALIIIGLTAYTPNGKWSQFWFFTAQTNLFVLIHEIIMVSTNFVELSGKKVKFKYQKWFTISRLLITYFITITGFVYCFVLAPVAVATKSELVNSFSYRDVILHVCVPIMTFVDYYLFGTKHKVDMKYSLCFLIYPIIYFIMANLRVVFGGNLLGNGSLYPYFFIDPTFNNQGWGMVIFYVIIFLIFFYLLACLFLYINDKLEEKRKIQY